MYNPIFNLASKTSQKPSKMTWIRPDPFSMDARSLLAKTKLTCQTAKNSLKIEFTLIQEIYIFHVYLYI
jgi:hypothetical protein